MSTKTITTPPFSLSSPPDRDIWRKPPAHDVFTAPTHPSELPKYPLKSLQRARITFTLPPVSSLEQFDQAGLLLHWTKAGEKDKWLKTGIEFYNGKPYVSTVGTDRWSDWSVVPLSSASASGTSGKGPTATIEAKRENDGTGMTLWVYQILRDEKGEETDRLPLREMTWPFAEEEGWEVGVGGMVARVANREGLGDLEAVFGEGFEVEVLDCEESL